MTEEIDLEKFASQLRKDFKSLPDKINARVISMITKPDRRGKQALFLQVQLDDGSTLTFKYGKAWVNDLAIAFKKIGFVKSSDIVGKKFEFERRTVKFMTADSVRYLPTKWLGD